MDLETFRQEARDFIESNCPQNMRSRVVNIENSHEVYDTDDARSWLQAAATRGWTAPTWPTEYGGGGLDAAHQKVLAEEMARIKALPAASGMGLAMIGPTILEMGTDEQRQRHDKGRTVARGSLTGRTWRGGARVG